MLDPAWLGIIIPVAIAAGTALSAYLTSRRSGSGQVRTSQADALWEQTQAMMTSLQRDKERAEDQRDKLIDLQETQIQPALEAISLSQKHVLDILTRLLPEPGQSGKMS